MIRARINTSQALRVIPAVLRQTIYSARDAINDTAKDFQRAEQQRVLHEFTVRQRAFILNTIKVGPGGFAKANRLSVIMQIDPARDELAKFEHGGRKVALQGKPYVAIPTKEIRRTKRGLIPRSLYPSAFKPYAEASNTRNHHSQVVGQQRTFFITTKGGNRLLLQRYGGTRGRHGLRALYLFVPSVPIDDRLEFVATARAVAASAYAPAFRRAFARNVSSARVR